MKEDENQVSFVCIKCVHASVGSVQRKAIQHSHAESIFFVLFHAWGERLGNQETKIRN